MAELYPSLLRMLIPRIGQQPATYAGLREWLVSGTYAATYDVPSQSVVLNNISPENLLLSWGHDYERFALASWESFSSFSLESEKLSLVSWPLLKLYYAAFFAAHAVLRATGMSIVKVERTQIDALNQIIFTVDGINPRLKPGIYQTRLTQVRPGQLRLNMTPHIDGSGVHDGFWKAFTTYLEELADDAVATNMSDASLLVAGVSELAPRTRGWLSARRNDINYQQLFGVWYPLVKGKVLNEQIRSVKRSESRLVSLAQPLEPPVDAFVKTCQFLACLNAEIGDYVAARSPQANSFGSRWRKFNSILDKAAA